MALIALIACSCKKIGGADQAQYLYNSNLFKLSFRYAQQRGAQRIYILSAKHGLLDPNEILMLRSGIIFE